MNLFKTNTINDYKNPARVKTVYGGETKETKRTKSLKTA